jgi:arginine-tRNA-protein transferase
MMSQNDENTTLDFYLTPEHECPYLVNETAQTIFLNPEVHVNDPIYDFLIERGFRRSGEHIYRPQCGDCRACISIRIPVYYFKPNKQQRRCHKKGNQFSVKVIPAQFDLEHYRLFENYIETRHSDGDMYPTSEKQYKEFVLSDSINTQFLDISDPKTGKLIACCVFDQLNSGLSAVYTFFDPIYSNFSPGRLAILQLIELSRHHQLSYVYLGYWITECQKMSYKGEYRPIECFVDDGWITLT